MKYFRRKIHRSFKNLGIPFLESQKLARCVERDGYVRAILDNNDFKMESVTRCPCCGPEAVRVTFSNNLVVEFPYGAWNQGFVYKNPSKEV